MQVAGASRSPAQPQHPWQRCSGPPCCLGGRSTVLAQTDGRECMDTSCALRPAGALGQGPWPAVSPAAYPGRQAPRCCAVAAFARRRARAPGPPRRRRRAFQSARSAPAAAQHGRVRAQRARKRHSAPGDSCPGQSRGHVPLPHTGPSNLPAATPYREGHLPCSRPHMIDACHANHTRKACAAHAAAAALSAPARGARAGAAAPAPQGTAGVKDIGAEGTITSD